jgi:hypothetical protein
MPSHRQQSMEDQFSGGEDIRLKAKRKQRVMLHLVAGMIHGENTKEKRGEWKMIIRL